MWNVLTIYCNYHKNLKIFSIKPENKNYFGLSQEQSDERELESRKPATKKKKKNI